MPGESGIVFQATKLNRTTSIKEGTSTTDWATTKQQKSEFNQIVVPS